MDARAAVPRVFILMKCCASGRLAAHGYAPLFHGSLSFQTELPGPGACEGLALACSRPRTRAKRAGRYARGDQGAAMDDSRKDQGDRGV